MTAKNGMLKNLVGEGGISVGGGEGVMWKTESKNAIVKKGRMELR